MKYLDKFESDISIQASDFLQFMSSKDREKLLKKADALRGKKIVHINATKSGGGVAEMLRRLIPYFRSLKVISEWYYINQTVGQKFFEITNKIHNGLQGSFAQEVNEKDWKHYQLISNRIADDIDTIECDVLVIHDPQPLLAGHLAKRQKKKVFFCHIDTSSPEENLEEKFLSMLNSYQSIVFSNKDFLLKDLPAKKVKIFTPAIDPLSPKQEIVPREKARLYLQEHGNIPLEGPLIVQVSRFDVWKNPIGVIEAFRIVQKNYPTAKLALVGFNEAEDNPLALQEHQKVLTAGGSLDNAFSFFYPEGRNIARFTAMAQNAADVIVQNSIREGFGLVVSEAMFKCQPVVGGPGSGIRRQIKDGKNGFIVTNPAQLAEQIMYLLSHPRQKEKMGKTAREIVVKHFLLPRLVLDHLSLYITCLIKQ